MKKIVKIVLLVSTILLIASLVTVSALQPAVRPQPTEVAANSCDADDTCEVNTLQVANGANVNNGLNVNNGPLRMTDPSWYISSHGWMRTSSFLLVGDGVGFDNWQTGMVRTNGPLELTQLAGTGNAYACLDSEGTLFRSDVPCN